MDGRPGNLQTTDDIMRSRVAILLAVWIGLAGWWSACFPDAVRAQQTTTITIVDPDEQILDLLRAGHQLELQRRWSEALTHYEDALRRHPGDPGLQRRFERVRMHYDLTRRYGDQTFCDQLARMSAGKALDLYTEVLRKIEAHYVEPPHWKHLVEQGTNELEVALDEPSFIECHLPQVDPRAVSNLRYELRRVVGMRIVAGREDARDTVAWAAQLAQQRIGLSPTAVIWEYLCGAANALDPYSAYLTAGQLNEVYAQIDGNFVGLGIELKAEEGRLHIVRVISGSPAEEGGLRAGEWILSVDGRQTAGLSTDQAADLLQGEEGSLVRLEVVLASESPRQVVLRRRRVEVPSVDLVKMLDAQEGVAYFRLACFQRSTPSDLHHALWTLHRQGMRVLIADLRGNPGGLLTTAVEVADLFLERGIIVSTRGRNVQEDFTYAAHPEGTWRVPLVVLVDHDSASAAEILAGALKDHGRGTVVGMRSYGKGSVQGIFPLSGCEAGLRLTTARFYSPSGQPYSGQGVVPHIVVHQAARPIGGQLPAAGDDPVLTAALHAARNLLAAR